MIKVYEISYDLSNLYPTILKLSMLWLALVIVIYGFKSAILYDMKETRTYEILKTLSQKAMIGLGVIMILTVGLSAYVLKKHGTLKEISKEHYSLEIVDNHIRLHSIEGKSLSMEVTSEDHTYHVSSLEIIEEKSDHYLCRVEEKNSSSIVKIMKNDYKFENNRRS